MKNLLLLLVLILLISCETQKKPTDDEQLNIEIHTINTGNNVEDILVFQNHIFLQLENAQIAVVDSSFQRKKDLEQKLEIASNSVANMLVYKGKLILTTRKGKYLVYDSSLNRITKLEKQFNRVATTYPIEYLDTLWVGDQKSIWFLNANDSFVIADLNDFIKRNSLANARKLLDNTKYLIYGCCFGSGGNVFFMNKRTKQIRLYPAMCPKSVYNWNGEYYIIDNDRHFGIATDILKITDPDKLFIPQMTPSSKKFFEPKGIFCCNCDTQNALYNTYKLHEEENSDKRVGVKSLFRSWGYEMFTASPSVRNGRLYSIQIADSFCRIIKYEGDTVKEIMRDHFTPGQLHGFVEAKHAKIYDKNITIARYTVPLVKFFILGTKD